MNRGDFCGSVRAQQTYKSLRMALILLLHPRSPIRFRVNKFLSAEMKRPAEKSGRPKCTEKPVISVLASVYWRSIIIGFESLAKFVADKIFIFSHYYFFIREKSFDISCEASA